MRNGSRAFYSVPTAQRQRRYRTAILGLGALTASVAVVATNAAAQTPPASTSATAPATQPAAVNVDPDKLAADRQRLADHLLQEYERLAQSPDFVSRSVAVMLAAKFPDPRVNDFLLKLAETDRHPAVQMLAWEGLLSRSAWITPEQHKRWLIATKTMARKQFFRGRLRAGLMVVLATAPADRASTTIAADVFTQTDSRRTDDDAALEALGRALAIWKDRGLADQLVSKLGTFGGAEKRALRVLHAAGFPLPEPPIAGATDTAGILIPPTAVSTDEMRTAVEWWRKQRLSWKSNGMPPDGHWRSTTSRLLPNLLPNQQVDPYDKQWYKDLELAKPDLSNFDVAFVIDVSGSMSPSVQWVKREITGMMTVLGLVAREPRVGLTFFGCRGDRIGVQASPLTGDIRKLTNALGQVTFASGGEELVFDGLRECVRTSRWSQGNKVAKVLILVGDEEIEPKQVADCNALAKAAVENGFRIYAICPRRVPDSYAEVCRLGNGEAFVLPLQPTRTPLLPPAMPPATQPATQPADAIPAPPGLTSSNPAEIIINHILLAAIRPEYRDRVAPLVAVIMAMNSVIEPEAERQPR